MVQHTGTNCRGGPTNYDFTRRARRTHAHAPVDLLESVAFLTLGHRRIPFGSGYQWRPPHGAGTARTATASDEDHGQSGPSARAVAGTPVEHTSICHALQLSFSTVRASVPVRRLRKQKKTKNKPIREK